MLFFKRILNFRREALAKLRDKRRSTRYPVGPGFPLKATLNLVGQAKVTARGSGCDWSGRLVNLSTNGLCLQLPPAATTVRGEQTDLRLSLDRNLLQIPCTVAHFRVYSSHALCGVSLEFGDFKIQKAYLQLVEGVSTGASFVPVESTILVRNSAGLVREQFRADNKAMLTAWRESPSRTLDSFELVMGDHCVKGGTRATLEVSSRKSERAPLSAIVDGEVRQLFQWVVSNLPKAVPADLRGLMERLASNRAAAFPPPGARSTPPIATAAPPRPGAAPSPSWQAPKPAQKESGRASASPGGRALSLPPRPPGPA